MWMIVPIMSIWKMIEKTHTQSRAIVSRMAELWCIVETVLYVLSRLDNNT